MAKHQMRQSLQTIDLKDARTTATLRANSMIAGGPANFTGQASTATIDNTTIRVSIPETLNPVEEPAESKEKIICEDAVIPDVSQVKMSGRVLETWINETLKDAEHLNIPGCIANSD